MNNNALVLICLMINCLTFFVRADDQPKESNSEERQAKSKMPLALLIKPSEEKPTPGKLQFVVEIVNKTKERVKLITNDKNPPFMVKIYNAQGELVNQEILSPTTRTRGQKTGELIFDPEDKKPYKVTYSEAKAGPEAGKPLPAGTYEVSAILGITSFTQGEEKVNIFPPFLLESKEIELTVPKEEAK